MQNGEQIGTAWPPVRRQGSCRQPRREIRVSAAGAGIQGSREECGAGPVSLLRGSGEGTLEPGPRLGTWAHGLSSLELRPESISPTLCQLLSMGSSVHPQWQRKEHRFPFSGSLFSQVVRLSASTFTHSAVCKCGVAGRNLRVPPALAKLREYSRRGGGQTLWAVSK